MRTNVTITTSSEHGRSKPIEDDVSSHALVVQWSSCNGGKTTYNRKQFASCDIGAALALYELCDGSKQLLAQYVRVVDGNAFYEWCAVLNNTDI